MALSYVYYPCSSNREHDFEKNLPTTLPYYTLVRAAKLLESMST